ncbi:MAG: CBS domain-containing protein [Wenzhouxiangellaceae bacterium]|jgi:CBS domain-containing protein|nr:CBS domain-containing protein [Wenzhouxiangellaceae bacterium]MBS3747872.1 CBS domain-containing protein [Wenzhouxiangellaceae bacterium]MBS3824282.1 CBS domain-containing protein [Wenzhouxiangellaceae bacterium]
MHTIHQILHHKGGDILWVAPESTVFDAIHKMAEKGVGALLVMREGKPVGMVSERDYARKVILEGRSSRDTRVQDIMSDSLITIDGRATADAGLALMTKHHIRHLPVVDDNDLIGMVSIGDLVNAVIDDQQQLIEQLERYVTG